MPYQTAATFTAFGKNQYLASTRADAVFSSYTVAAAVVHSDADGNKVLQSGTVLAKCTSGGSSGLVGPYEADATDGRQTSTNIVGVCDTFLPYQLNNGNYDVAVLKTGRVDSSVCYEYPTGVTVAPGTRGLGSGTKTALATRTADLDITLV